MHNPKRDLRFMSGAYKPGSKIASNFEKCPFLLHVPHQKSTFYWQNEHTHSYLVK